MQVLQIVSVVLEAVIASLGVRVALLKKKSYGWCIALTFAIYVFYDSVYLFDLQVGAGLMKILFFIATISMLWSVWRIYKE